MSGAGEEASEVIREAVERKRRGKTSFFGAELFEVAPKIAHKDCIAYPFRMVPNLVPSSSASRSSSFLYGSCLNGINTSPKSPFQIQQITTFV